MFRCGWFDKRNGGCVKQVCLCIKLPDETLVFTFLDSF